MQPPGCLLSILMTLLFGLGVTLLGVTSGCDRAAAEMQDVDITRIPIDPARRHQTITGWGTCLNTWTPDLTNLYKRDGFSETYAKTMGMNMLRVNLWPDVLPRRDDPQAISYRDFDYGGEGKRLLVFLDFARRLKAQNPEARIIGSVWSPPAWMKVNGAIKDDESGAIDGDSYANKEDPKEIFTNRLDMARLPHFAAWLVEMVKVFDENGTPLYALSIANEPQFTQWFESCVWTADDYAKAVQAVGEALEAAGYGDVLIFGPETMTGFNWPKANPLYLEKLLGDPAVAGQFDVFATHGYSDGFKADHTAESSWEFARLIAPHDRPYWVTEGGTGGHVWPEPIDGMAMCLHNALVHGGASAVVPWQISETETNDGALLRMGELTKKSHVARHWMAMVRPGAVRVEATPSDKNGVHASAFVHEEQGLLTIVLVNASDSAQKIELSVPGVEQFEVARVTDADRSFALVEAPPVQEARASLTLPPNSVWTLQAR